MAFSRCKVLKFQSRVDRCRICSGCLHFLVSLAVCEINCLYTYKYKCVCMYVCMYVRMYVSMYV